MQLRDEWPLCEIDLNRAITDQRVTISESPPAEIPPLSKKKTMVKVGNLQSKPKGKGPAQGTSAGKTLGSCVKGKWPKQRRNAICREARFKGEEASDGKDAQGALEKQVFLGNYIGARIGSLLATADGDIVRGERCGEKAGDCRYVPAYDLSRAQRKALEEAANLWALIKEAQGLHH